MNWFWTMLLGIGGAVLGGWLGMMLGINTDAGLTGWIAYAYGRNRYHDFVSRESYWGDYDQRHTFNAYALYTHSDRTNVVTKLRMGSNFPIPGYYVRRADGTFFVGAERNTERLPLYARLDVRANRTFVWSHRRVTGFVEVICGLTPSDEGTAAPGTEATRVVSHRRMGS